MQIDLLLLLLVFLCSYRLGQNHLEVGLLLCEFCMKTGAQQFPENEENDCENM